MQTSRGREARLGDRALESHRGGHGAARGLRRRRSGGARPRGRPVSPDAIRRGRGDRPVHRRRAPEDCTGQGLPIDVPDIVDDAIEEALRQGIDVRTIENQEDAALLEGLSAVLRFR